MKHRLWFFNPGHEEALRVPLSQRYTPPKVVRRLAEDLSDLMLLMAESGDYVWHQQYDGSVVITNHQGEMVEDYTTLPPLTLAPWAIEPHALRSVCEQAEGLGLQVTAPAVSAEYLSLSHRASSLDLLQTLCKQRLADPALLPRWLYTSEEARASLRPILHEMQHKFGIDSVIVKRPFTSSGRGVMPFSLPLAEDKAEQLIKSCDQWQGFSIEKRLNVSQNWATEYEYRSGQARYIGLSHFYTQGANGAYKGNSLCGEDSVHGAISAQIGGKILDAVIEAQTDFLQSYLGAHYEGYIGVDMFTYTDEEGQMHLHPAVEINPRCTMGLLAHQAYKRHLEEGELGLFKIVYAPESELAALYAEHREAGEERYISLTRPKAGASSYAYIHKLSPLELLCGEIPI